MSNAARTDEMAELTAPYWLDSPVLKHGSSPCRCDDLEPSQSDVAALRFIDVGVAGV
ncbi:hypothetical protein ACYSUO_23425 [Streptomyces sp. UC4497]